MVALASMNRTIYSANKNVKNNHVFEVVVLDIYTYRYIYRNIYIFFFFNKGSQLAPPFEAQCGT